MLNRIIIMGRLTRDPELRYTPNNVAVTTITVAVDRDYARQGEQKETDFIDVVAWRATAEFVVKWFHKGSMIVVDGKLQSRKWKDKYDQNRVSFEIIADNVHFGESKASGESRGTYERPLPEPPMSQPQYVSQTQNSQPQQSYTPAAPKENFSKSPSGFVPLPEDDELPF